MEGVNLPMGDGTAEQNERGCPHIVEVAVPPSWLGASLVLIFAFHHECGIEIRRGRSTRRGSQDFVRWRFLERTDAQAFAKLIGGKLITQKLL